MPRAHVVLHHPGIRFPLAFLVGLMLLGAHVGSAAAAPREIERDTVMVASAVATTGFDCPPGIPEGSTEGCYSNETLVVEVVSRREASKVCVSMTSTRSLSGSPPAETSGFGCAEIPDSVFSIDRALSSASLEPLPVTVDLEVCFQFQPAMCNAFSEELIISASWTGVGELSRVHNKNVSGHGKCRSMSMEKVDSRDATATVTIAGEPGWILHRGTVQAGDADLSSVRSFMLDSKC